MPGLRTLLALLLVSLVSLGCASGSARRDSGEPLAIVRIERAYTNSYLLLGSRVVVIDPGPPGNAKRLLRILRHRGHTPQDVALIVVTHGHADHAGAAAELRARTGAPIVAGAGDAAMIDRGHNDKLEPTGPAGRRILPFIGQDYPGFIPDLEVVDDLDLHAFGLPARLLVTPGHTPGSLVLALDDGRAIGGDLVRGKFTARSRPVLHFFHADPGAAHQQLAALLDRHGVRRLHPGHGHALAEPDLRAYLRTVK